MPFYIGEDRVWNEAPRGHTMREPDCAMPLHTGTDNPIEEAHWQYVCEVTGFLRPKGTPEEEREHDEWVDEYWREARAKGARTQ